MTRSIFTVPRRKDVFHEPNVMKPHRRPRRGYMRSLYADIDRGLRYFWSRPHRVGNEAATMSFFNPP